MAFQRAPTRAEALYWRGAVLGDLGRHREALRSIESAQRAVQAEDRWLLEELFADLIRKTAESPEFARASERLGVRPAFLPSEEFGELIANEDASLAKLMQAIGLKKQP